MLSVSTTYSSDEFGDVGFVEYVAWGVMVLVTCKGDGFADERIVSRVPTRSDVMPLMPRSRRGIEE